MGGFGSGKSWRGRKKRNGKVFVEYLTRLDISELMKLHKNGSSSFSLGSIGLVISENTIYFGEKINDKIKTIQTTSLPCYFGGVRFFCLCPNCNKQFKILYWNTTFACRECLNLAYRSQNITLSLRLIFKRTKIGNLIHNNEWEKPKWMKKKDLSKAS